MAYYVALCCELVVALALAGCLVFMVSSTANVDSLNIERGYKTEGVFAVVNDTPYAWTYEPAQDLQDPELPTGCEATAAATLVRMHGFPVTKQAVADAMPKSNNGTDFVHSFYGNPYSKSGWATMAPCVVDTLNSLGELNGWAAFDATGTELEQLELPAEVWVTIDLGKPSFTGIEQDGYRLAWNPHAVTVTDITADTVCCVDPLQGCATYDRQTFEAVYKKMGQQAVVVKEWQ